jgi:hypothetical protein
LNDVELLRIAVLPAKRENNQVSSCLLFSRTTKRSPEKLTISNMFSFVFLLEIQRMFALNGYCRLESMVSMLQPPANWRGEAPLAKLLQSRKVTVRENCRSPFLGQNA